MRCERRMGCQNRCTAHSANCDDGRYLYRLKKCVARAYGVDKQYFRDLGLIQSVSGRGTKADWLGAQVLGARWAYAAALRL